MYPSLYYDWSFHVTAAAPVLEATLTISEVIEEITESWPIDDQSKSISPGSRFESDADELNPVTGSIYLWDRRFGQEKAHLLGRYALTKRAVSELAETLEKGQVLFSVPAYYRYRGNRVINLPLDELLTHACWMIRSYEVCRVEGAHLKIDFRRNPAPRYQPHGTELSYRLIPKSEAYQWVERETLAEEVSS